MPRSDYPPDPWVKGYAQESDCLGGEKLAAIKLDLPQYPNRAFKGGRQGWTIVRLDVGADGNTQNVAIERAVPHGGMFEKPSLRAVKNWTFAPPKTGPLTACRVLIQYRLGAVTLGR
jgi:TonB family protein